MKNQYNIAITSIILISLTLFVNSVSAQSYGYGISFKRNGHLWRIGTLNGSNKPFTTIGSDYPCGPGFAFSIEDITNPARGAFNIDGPFFWCKVNNDPNGDIVNPHYPDEELRSPEMVSMRQTAQIRLKGIRVTLNHQTRRVNNRSHEIALTGFKTYYPEYVREINLGPNREAAQAINIEPLLMDGLLATQQLLLDQEKMLEDLNQLRESQDKLKTENESLKAIITEYQRKETAREERIKAIEARVFGEGGLNKSEESKPSKTTEDNADPISEVKIGPNYPNPAQSGDPITIPYEIPASTKDAALVISDSQGKLIHQQDLNPIDKKITVNLNTLNIASGQYTYSLKIGEQVIGTLKMIVL